METIRRSQTDTLTLGAGPGAAWGCSVCRLPRAFQERRSASGGDPKGQSSCHRPRGSEGRWREGGKETLLGGGAGARSREWLQGWASEGLKLEDGEDDEGWGRGGGVRDQLTVLQRFVHQQKTQQQPDLHLQGKGWGRGAGDSRSEARGKRRARAGAPGEAAGEGRAPGTPQLEDSVS